MVTNDDLTPAALRRGIACARRLMNDPESTGSNRAYERLIRRWQGMLREMKSGEPVIVNEAELDEWLERQRESW
jgi:hypothetical protein